MRPRPTIAALSFGMLLSASVAANPAAKAQQTDPSKSSPAQTSGESGKDTLAPVVPPLIILAPAEIRAEPTLARGCWVQLFPQPDFQGQNELTIAGPIALPSLHTPAGDIYWRQKAESLIAGPRASVTVYESPSFGGPSVTIAPGTRHDQLRKQLQFNQSIDSLKIECTR